MSQTASPSTTRRARTRAKLVAAAAQAIGELGLRGATTDEIANRVGMTKGAIYGNFASKEDLFLAVVEAMPVGIGPAIKAGDPFKIQMRQLGRAVVRMARNARPVAALAAEFDLYALTSEAMRVRLEQFYKARNKRTADMLAELIAPRDLPLPPEQFAVMINALIGGLLHQHYVAPELATEKTIVAVFEALA